MNVKRFGPWIIIVAACSSGPPEAASPSAADAAVSAEPAASSPGAECVAEASAEREPLEDAPRKITVRHVLVKHAEAAGAPADITRSREEACLRALEAHAALSEGTSFDEVVATFSDDPGAETRGGLVGEVSREEVEPAFGEVAFRLEVGQGSYVVETRKGFHIILRDR